MKLYNMNFHYVKNDRLPDENLDSLITFLMGMGESKLKIAVYGMGEAGQKILCRLSQVRELEVIACFDIQFKDYDIPAVLRSPDDIGEFLEIDLIINTAPPQYLFDINNFILNKNGKLNILNLYDVSEYIADDRNWEDSYKILVSDSDLTGPLADYHKLVASKINKRIKNVLAKIESQRTVLHTEILEELKSAKSCLGTFLNKKFDEVAGSRDNRIERFLSLAERFPFFTMARDAAATLLVKEGKLEEAVRAFEPTIEMYPCCRFSLQKLAELQALCGNFEKSKKNIYEGLKFFPNSYDLKVLLNHLECRDLKGIAEKWKAREVRPALKAGKVNLRCAVPVWGEKYIKIFMEFSLGSLLAPGNLPYAAKERDICFEIYSYKNEFDTIRSYPQWDILNSLTRVELIDIDSIKVKYKDRFSNTYKYSDMSMCQNCALERSSKDGKVLFFPLADFVFSSNFVKNALVKLDKGYDVLFANNLRVDRQKICKKIKPKFVKNNILEIPADNFFDLVSSSMHLYSSLAKSKKNTPMSPAYFVYEDMAGNILYTIYSNNPVFLNQRNLNLQMDTAFDGDLPYRATDGGLGQYVFSNDINEMLIFEIVDENDELSCYVKRDRNLEECAYWIYGRIDPLLRYFGTRMMQYKKSKDTQFRDDVYSEFISESLKLVL